MAFLVFFSALWSLVTILVALAKGGPPVKPLRSPARGGSGAAADVHTLRMVLNVPASVMVIAEIGGYRGSRPLTKSAVSYIGATNTKRDADADMPMRTSHN